MKLDHRKYLRIPYTKADCWRLIQRVYADCGRTLPDFSAVATDAAAIALCVAGAMSRFVRLEVPETPCVVAICNDADDPTRINHFGVYLGDGVVLHTLATTGPSVWRLNHPFWAKRIEGFYAPVE